MKHATLASLALATFTSSALAGDVLYVDGSGGADFDSVAAAVAAARDGDVIYVMQLQTGEDLRIVGKGITVVNTVWWWSPNPVEIRDVPAGSTVVLRGGAAFRRSTNFLVEDCSGGVVIDDVQVDDWGFASDLANEALLTIRRSDAVTVRNSSLDYFLDSGSVSKDIVEVVDSTVMIDGCHLIGGDGIWGEDGIGICSDCCTSGGDGMGALAVRGASIVRVQSSVLRGGHGGWGPNHNNCFEGDDAPSYEVEAGADVTLVDTMLAGTGYGVGLAETLFDAPRSFVASTSVDAGNPFTLESSGELGDTVYALVFGDLVAHPISAQAGFLQLAGSRPRARLGSLGPTGMRTTTWTAPPVAPGQVLSIPFQAVFVDASGQPRLSPARVVEVRGAGVPAW